MTEKDTIEHIITTGKFPRKFDDYLNYGSLIAPIGFVAIGYSMIYNYNKFHSGYPMLMAGSTIISLGVLFTFFILIRLNDNMTFSTIPTIAGDNIDTVAKKLKQEFNLRGIDVNKELNRIIAFTKTTGFSWGEQVTLIFNKDCVLVNSRPGGSRQPFTIMKDRQNIKKVEQIL